MEFRTCNYYIQKQSSSKTLYRHVTIFDNQFLEMTYSNRLFLREKYSQLNSGLPSIFSVNEHHRNMLVTNRELLQPFFCKLLCFSFKKCKIFIRKCYTVQTRFIRALEQSELLNTTVSKIRIKEMCKISRYNLLSQAFVCLIQNCFARMKKFSYSESVIIAHQLQAFSTFENH